MSGVKTNGAGEKPAGELVVVSVEDQISQALAGREGSRYASPPQARDQALALVRVLLGYTGQQLNGGDVWTCPIAGGRRTVALKLAAGSGQ
jgi:hypothetical protein